MNYEKRNVLRNLLAHVIEQTSKIRDELTMYVVIIDMLIDTKEDLAISTRQEVIENHLENDERLVEMWNDMCVNVSTRPCQRGCIYKWEENN